MSNPDAPEWASYARERHEAENEAVRRGWPISLRDLVDPSEYMDLETDRG